ncbi:MAG TPA: exosortase H [Thermoanaerobaculales bacterium]|mgnify:FL=1|nr:exosortase H [Thermoanaerobaculales bacterium]HPA81648.1 exosortase H [Thermoanaerobaculales bacterium]HQL29787.1 exosortase H [Thermoanaerobaculales bacterium]HQP43372.1 exosortase H [Thermoanaerobaculales bacterium]
MTSVRALWRRPDVRFLVLFLGILLVAFTTIAFQKVNDAVVNPYTGFVARLSGAVLGLIGEDITVTGCELRSPRFAVTIYNGCNGLITSLIFVSGVLAFPASWRAKAVGVIAGLLAIQALNLVRIVSLYYIGVFLPDYFDESHILIGQSLVILAGVGLWIVWARSAAAASRAAR